MKSSVLVCLFLFASHYPSHAQPLFPGIYDYVEVDEEPQILNWGQIHRSIGYPLSAARQGIEGKVCCRILVDGRGHYQAHRIIKSCHPLLDEAVERHVSLLRFAPARRGGLALPYWVNVPFHFDLSQSREAILSQGRWELRRLFPLLRIGSRAGSEEYAAEASRLEAGGDWTSALEAYTRALRQVPQRHFEQQAGPLLLSRAKLLIRLGEYSRAQGDLAALLAFGASDKALSPVETEAYLVRAAFFLRLGQPLRSLDDCNWLLASASAPPAQAAALALRSRAQLALGNPAEALNDAEEASALLPGMAEACLSKALALSAIGSPEAACETLAALPDLGAQGLEFRQQAFALQERSCP